MYFLFSNDRDMLIWVIALPERERQRQIDRQVETERERERADYYLWILYRYELGLKFRKSENQ